MSHQQHQSRELHWFPQSRTSELDWVWGQGRGACGIQHTVYIHIPMHACDNLTELGRAPWLQNANPITPAAQLPRSCSHGSSQDNARAAQPKLANISRSRMSVSNASSPASAGEPPTGLLTSGLSLMRASSRPQPMVVSSQPSSLPPALPERPNSRTPAQSLSDLPPGGVGGGPEAPRVIHNRCSSADDGHVKAMNMASRTAPIVGMENAFAAKSLRSRGGYRAKSAHAFQSNPCTSHVVSNGTNFYAMKSKCAAEPVMHDMQC